MRRDLRFLACGQVDSGKSTLIGRLLSDIGAVPEDERAQVYAHVTDGLEAERAKGITIDVAYRFFRHGDRHYRIADTPGHTHYTRNMAVAAADSDYALIVVDAARGIDAAALRHARIAAFFGIRIFLLAVNKMDLAGYGEAHFKEAEAACRAALENIPGASLSFVPVAALQGDNLAARSAHMPWYSGPSVLECLAQAEPPGAPICGARLPVQQVLQADGARLYAGMLSGGGLKPGDTLSVAGSALRITVTRLYHSGNAVNSAKPGQAIAIAVEQAADIARGALLCAADAPAWLTERFDAAVLWLDDDAPQQTILPALIKLHGQEEQAEIRTSSPTRPIGRATVLTASPLAMDAYETNRSTGLFLVIQPETERVIGVGIVLGLALVPPAG